MWTKSVSRSLSLYSVGLQPYPSLELQGTAGNCTGLVSAYRIRIDRCNRLWVMDSGVITTLETYSPVCPPKILVFDLKTDSLVRTIILPREVSSYYRQMC